jgi:hypothetical protein
MRDKKQGEMTFRCTILANEAQGMQFAPNHNKD